MSYATRGMPSCGSCGTLTAKCQEGVPMPIALRTLVGRRFAQLIRDEDRAEAERVAAARRAFKEGFRRSRKGNLWRTWNEVQVDGRTVTVTLTIFGDRSGGCSFCIAAPGGPIHS